MAYTSLYRKYRPRKFSEMIGQQHIRQTLKNAVLSSNIAHAYLFTGSRGTGKTSTAKIFAQAINCLHPEQDGSPCGKCEICKELNGADNLDIVELDAASNNSVEDIRSIIEKVKFAPASGHYKVYIIDEVHMLSPQAFNAFLKTLEEPPEHAVFILATTDIQRIPPTILSRCLRFDFRLISNEELAAHVKKIFDLEGIEYEDAAIAAIAEAGNGSARDTLSIADMVISYCGNNRITYNSVLEVLGASSPLSIYEICDNIVLSKIDKALSLTNDLINRGKSVGVLAEDLAKMMNNILYAKNCKDAKEILGLPNELFEKISNTALSADNSKLYRASEIFASIQNALRFSSLPKVVLETAVAKACDVSASVDEISILRRIADLEAFKRTLQAEGTKEGTTVTGKKIWGDLLNQIAEDKSKIHYERSACEGVIKYGGQIVIANREIWISLKNDEAIAEINRYKEVVLRQIQAKYPEIQNIKINKDVEPIEQAKEQMQNLFGNQLKK